MNQKVFISLVVALVFSINYSQNIKSLKHKIDRVLMSKKLKAGIAITGYDENDTISINGHLHFPMQSDFKYPIALYVLSEIDKGKFSLNLQIEIKMNNIILKYPFNIFNCCKE